MSSELVIINLLAKLKALYPLDHSVERDEVELHPNPWDIVAAVAFSASNLPEAVPIVFKYALDDLRAQRLATKPQVEVDAEEIMLVRRIKDAVFKAGIICGYPKAINALVALHPVVPENLRDNQPLRDISLSTDENIRRGRDFFNRTYGENAESVQTLLDDIYPDLGYFTTAHAYGFTYSFGGVSPTLACASRETSYTMIASLIASDTPRQISWHLAGAQRNGASVAQVKAVREMAIIVAKVAGVKWKGEIPDVIERERLDSMSKAT